MNAMISLNKLEIEEMIYVTRPEKVIMIREGRYKRLVYMKNPD